MDQKAKAMELMKQLDEKIKEISVSVDKLYPAPKTELEKRLLVAREMQRQINLEVYKLEQYELQEKIKAYVQ